MPRHALPTDAELEILRVLWARGPNTVRDIHEALGAERGTGYTTTLKQLQNMFSKGFVVRDSSRHVHVYGPAVDEAVTIGNLVGRVVDRLFAGSGAELAMRALDRCPASLDEIAELRRLLDRQSRRER